MNKLPKFKTSFSFVVKPATSAEKDKYLALASIDKLRPFLPNVNAETNYDLLPIAFNSCVVGRVNLNDDVISPDVAISLYKNFINKQINSEHDRSRIIGCVLTAGFSKFGSDEIITEEEARASKEPFNITLGGVIWRVANYDLAEVIEQSGDPTSEHYLRISASWELGFDEYDIVLLDDGKKNIEDGQIVEEAAAVQNMEEHLRCYGGSGKIGDKRVYRRVKGFVLPFGIGLTENPAADVKGIVSASASLDEQINASKEFQPEVRSEILTVLRNHISQSRNTDVKKDSIMKITSVKDITDESLKQTNASAIQEFIEQEIRKSSEEYTKTVSEKESAAKATQEKYDTLVAEHDKLKTSVDALTQELNKLKTEAATRERQAIFSSRMSAFDAAYNLSDEDRQVIATQIRDLNEEAFKTAEANLSVLLREKKKAKAAAQQTVASTQVAAPATDAQAVVDKAVDDSKKEPVVVAATTTPAAHTMKDRFAKHFGMEGFEITVNHKRKL